MYGSLSFLYKLLSLRFLLILAVITWSLVSIFICDEYCGCYVSCCQLSSYVRYLSVPLGYPFEPHILLKNDYIVFLLFCFTMIVIFLGRVLGLGIGVIGMVLLLFGHFSVGCLVWVLVLLVLVLLEWCCKYLKHESKTDHKQA